MKIEKHVRDEILCMSNVRGNKIKVEKNIPFSFYFSGQQGEHSIRVKPMFNPQKLRDNLTGVLELHGDWEYTPGPEDSSVSDKQIAQMKQFFRKYLILFAATWDRQIGDGDVYDYLVGDISLNDLVKCFDFYEDYASDLNKINTIEELEQYCRDRDLVNLYGN